MPIYKDKNILFIHVPKTAGTTIETALGGRSKEHLYDASGKLPDQIVTRQHLFASEYRKYTGDAEYDNLYKFSVVRNPYDRLVSAYHFISKNKYVPQKIKNMSFDEFVKATLPMSDIERRYLFDGHLEPQIKYIDEDNIKIFKFEKLKSCFTSLNKKFGPLVFEHHLKSDRRPWKKYYTPELKELVYNFYKEDFDRFGYTL